jgi:glyoxalase family protein
MENRVSGIHHITAIAGNARRNHAFYTNVLGLRFIKKTVNFDDPHTYHFYFGDEAGTPGTILTFFPWEGINKGRQGTGMATEIAYSVPPDSLGFWMERLKEFSVKVSASGTRFGEHYLGFEDPDGLPLTLIVPTTGDNRRPWETEGVGAQVATRGFHSITLTLKSVARTAMVLTDILDYKLAGQEGNRYRYVTDAVTNAAIVDLIEAPTVESSYNASGTIHHVAFRVRDEKVLMEFREKVVDHGLPITDKIDRNYFFSLYFREPGGVLFELATDNPGFTVDEPLAELGSHLKLPPQHERNRAAIEKVLPDLG